MHKSDRSLWEMRRIWLVGFLLLPFLLAFAAWIGFQHAKEQALQQAGERLNLYASSFEGAINKYDYLPWMIAQTPDVRRLLDHPDSSLTDDINSFLADTRNTSLADEVYLMDEQGLTLASSNFQHPDSFVGNNYRFRPYFTEAIRSGRGSFFAIGTTTGLPGYFLSERVTSESGEQAGVAVVKVDLEPLQADWQLAAEKVFVSDNNSIIVLSSHPQWKYRYIDVLSEEQLDAIRRNRQFDTVELKPLGVQHNNHFKVMPETDGETAGYLNQTLDLSPSGWSIHYLVPVLPLYQFALLVAGLVLILYILCLTGVLWMRERSRRAQAALKAEQRLRALNDSLEDQVKERTSELQRIQRELVQSEKLAALGIMAAGLSHELNQPLTAVRTYAASGRKLLTRALYQQVDTALDKIMTLTSRMSDITSQLKVFVRQAPALSQPVDWSARIDFVLEMLEHRIQQQQVSLHADYPPQALVRADDARIEQILVNLLSNALDAVSSTPDPQVKISLQENNQGWLLQVEDNGPGFASEQIKHLFEPFYSTKNVGQGMGLGLFICYGLVQDLDGHIRAESPPEGGARFEVWLPFSEQKARAA
ncbi:two-component system, NtrC family, C4-dicarboxylate transport sensor histidine kinase DctB [Marinospirillum celere]|uniref:C4-dicarboxylate transport sensor protein DctB n=1 Tax=Marinospirillum celere TaxID=1122252 RepID=A0A1I1JKP4_9GAMM|nr:ATP-binding protein [Marinospirillum celere]SFC48552.1 two-component system, NtrC family, C4-dicarboxylate transport sensor histidine kinase DctB [Marinospirillum celere]